MVSYGEKTKKAGGGVMKGGGLGEIKIWEMRSSQYRRSS